MISVYEDTDFVKLHVWPIDKDYLSTNIFFGERITKSISSHTQSHPTAFKFPRVGQSSWNLF